MWNPHEYFWYCGIPDIFGSRYPGSREGHSGTVNTLETQGIPGYRQALPEESLRYWTRFKDHDGVVSVLMIMAERMLRRLIDCCDADDNNEGGNDASDDDNIG